MIKSACSCADALAMALAADLDGTFERLVCEYQDRIYAFARTLSGNTQDAEEIAQDAFLRAYSALRGYTAERIADLALRPWLYQIALNVFRNRVRRPRLAAVPLEGADGASVEVEGSASERPEVAFEAADQGHELLRQVHALPPRFREAVILRHVEGFTYREIADVLHQPVGTVKSDVHRGTLLLRSALYAQMSEVR